MYFTNGTILLLVCVLEWKATEFFIEHLNVHKLSFDVGMTEYQ